MNKYQDFIKDHASHLMLGESERLPGCPECWDGSTGPYGTACQITHTEDGYLVYCYRCQKSKFLKEGGLSYKDIQQNLQRAKNLTWKARNSNNPNQYQLPPDLSTDNIPKGLEALLLKNHFYTKDLGIMWGYSESYQRLVFEVNNGWTGRRTPGHIDLGPKWFIQRKDNTQPTYLHLTTVPTDPIIIVEDVLSCIRAHQAGFNSIALLNTWIPTSLFKIVRSHSGNIIIWLDADAKLKSIKGVQRLSQYGIIVKAQITTTKDPKGYTINQFKEIINYEETCVVLRQ